MKAGMDGTAGLARQLKPGRPSIDVREFAGGMRQEMATLPQVRAGGRWLSTPQIVSVLLPIAVAAALALVLGARELRTLPEVQAFIARYPGTGAFAPPVESGFPGWLRAQHFLNFFLLLFLMRSGLQILADHPRLYLDPHCTPGKEWLRLRGPVPVDGVWTAKQDSVALPQWLGLPGIRHSIGLARWWHATLDTLWLANGLLFYGLLFSTDQWMRIVPQSWDVFPNAASTALQYASLDFPPAGGWHQYNGLQALAYFTTVFVAAPLAVGTGVLQAPAVAARFRTAMGVLNRQVARTIHFGVLAYFVFFLVTHVTMVFSTGIVRNLNHITRGANDDSWLGPGLFLAGMAVVVLAWLAASPLTLRFPRRIQHGGRLATGWIRNLLERMPPVARFAVGDVSPHFWPNGTPPDSEEYRRHLAEGFSRFRLRVGGMVEQPLEIPYADLRALPKTEQVTQHYCIQGWSGIARWGGVRVAEIMKRVRPLPGCRYVVFYSFARGAGADEGLYYDVHKIEHMDHESTILAYEMNGRPLPELHGAPLRLRNELELGFKQVKWVQALVFVSSFEGLGSGEGGFNEDHEYFGYRAPM